MKSFPISRFEARFTHFPCSSHYTSSFSFLLYRITDERSRGETDGLPIGYLMRYQLFDIESSLRLLKLLPFIEAGAYILTMGPLWMPGRRYTSETLKYVFSMLDLLSSSSIRYQPCNWLNFIMLKLC